MRGQTYAELRVSKIERIILKMDILKNAHNLGKKLRLQHNAKASALAELARITQELDLVYKSNFPTIWKKRRRAQLLFEQATAQRFANSCH